MYLFQLELNLDIPGFNQSHYVVQNPNGDLWATISPRQKLHYFLECFHRYYNADFLLRTVNIRFYRFRIRKFRGVFFLKFFPFSVYRMRQSASGCKNLPVELSILRILLLHFKVVFTLRSSKVFDKVVQGGLRLV